MNNIPSEIALKGTESVRKYIEHNKRIEELESSSLNAAHSIVDNLRRIKSVKNPHGKVLMSFENAARYYSRYESVSIYHALINLESIVKSMIKESLKMVDSQREIENLEKEFIE